jgi:hypothetical protein
MPELTISNDDLVVLAEQLLLGGNTLSFRASGGSMRPFILDGDILEIEPCQADRLRLTDILLYKNQNQRLLVHRLVAINRGLKEPEVTLQGDAFVISEAPIPVQQVLGRVITIRRGGKIIYLDSAIERQLARLWVALEPFRLAEFRCKSGLKQLLHQSKKG